MNTTKTNFSKDDVAATIVLAGLFFTVAAALFSANPANATPYEAAAQTHTKFETIVVTATKLK